MPLPSLQLGRLALRQALISAEAKDAKFIVVTDPMAEELLIAEQNAEGDWHIFSQSELAIILIAHLVAYFKQREPAATRYVVIASKNPLVRRYCENRNDDVLSTEVEGGHEEGSRVILRVGERSFAFGES